MMDEDEDDNDNDVFFTIYNFLIKLRLKKNEN